MNANPNEVNAAIQVMKPVADVFEAIANPDHMTNYWISESSGRMEEGAELMWSFPEFEGEFPVQVGKVVQDELITFYWDSEAGVKHEVTFTLSTWKESATVVRITEKPVDGSNPGIKWLKDNTQGWANFLASLKAWAEYRVNLRKGAFDFRFENL